jgi:hypothetical protein
MSYMRDKAGVRLDSISVVDRPFALAKLHAGLAASLYSPVRIAFCGSSTMAGANATLTERRWVNQFVAMLQAAYTMRTPSTVAANTGAVFGTLSTDNGIHGYNAAEGGTTSANYLTSGKIVNIAALAPRAIFHMVGAGDFGGGITPTTMKSNMQARIADLKAAISNPHVHVIVNSYPRMDVVGPPAPWADYGEAQRQIALADPDNVVYIDLAPYYALLGVPGTDPLDLIDIDNIHQRDAAHALMADLVRRELHLPGFPLSRQFGGLVVAQDAFQRADAAVLGFCDTGDVWSVIGTWAITSGRASAGAGGSYATIDIGRGDQDVSAVVVMNGVSTGNIGLTLNFIDSGNRLAFYVDASNGQAFLSKLDSGSLTSLSATGANAVTLTAATVVALRVTSKGNVLTGFVNGVQVAQYVMTPSEQAKYKAANRVGIRQSVTGNGAYESFAVRSI